MSSSSEVSPDRAMSNDQPTNMSGEIWTLAFSHTMDNQQNIALGDDNFDMLQHRHKCACTVGCWKQGLYMHWIEGANRRIEYVGMRHQCGWCDC